MLSYNSKCSRGGMTHLRKVATVGALCSSSSDGTHKSCTTSGTNGILKAKDYIKERLNLREASFSYMCVDVTNSVWNSVALQDQLTRSISFKLPRKTKKTSCRSLPHAFSRRNCSSSHGISSTRRTTTSVATSLKCPHSSCAKTSQGKVTSRDETLSQVEFSSFYKNLSLAQKVGLEECPPLPLTKEEWKSVKKQSDSRGDGRTPCAICLEDFRDRPQVILSCSHVYHETCLESFERCFQTPLFCPICRRNAYYKRSHTSGKEAWREECAIRIQKAWRGYNLRKEVWNLLRELNRRERIRNDEDEKPENADRMMYCDLQEDNDNNGTFFPQQEDKRETDKSICERDTLLEGKKVISMILPPTSTPSSSTIAFSNSKTIHLIRKYGAKALKSVTTKLIQKINRDNSYVMDFIDEVDLSVENARDTLTSALQHFEALHHHHPHFHYPPPRDSSSSVSNHEGTEPIHPQAENVFRVSTSDNNTSTDANVDGIHFQSSSAAASLETVEGKTTTPSQWRWAELQALQRADAECPICWQPLTAPYRDEFQNTKNDTTTTTSHSSTIYKPLYILNCSHVFHKTCLLNFEMFHPFHVPTCPMCRSPYSKQTWRPINHLHDMNLP